MTIARRSFVLAALALAACRRGSTQERCPHCGMLVDPKSAFRTELVTNGTTKAYDTPRCALAALRAATGGTAGTTMRVQEFYTRDAVDAQNVRFVGGSDVEGPMGAELVPIAPEKVEKFMKDHRGARVYKLDEITRDVLKNEGAP